MFTLLLNITTDFEDAPLAAEATILYADRPVATFTIDPYDAMLMSDDRDARDAYIAAKIGALFTVLAATEEGTL